MILLIIDLSTVGQPRMWRRCSTGAVRLATASRTVFASGYSTRLTSKTVAISTILIEAVLYMTQRSMFGSKDVKSVPFSDHHTDCSRCGLWHACTTRGRSTTPRKSFKRSKVEPNSFEVMHVDLKMVASTSVLQAMARFAAAPPSSLTHCSRLNFKGKCLLNASM